MRENDCTKDAICFWQAGLKPLLTLMSFTLLSCNLPRHQNSPFVNVTSNMTDFNEVQSASLGLVLHAQHIFANSFNWLVTWGLSVTIFYSTCIFCVYGMALYWPTLQFYLCVYISFVCRYVAPPGECYYNTILLQLRVFEARASSSSPRLPLCQILFLSQLSLLS